MDNHTTRSTRGRTGISRRDLLAQAAAAPAVVGLASTRVNMASKSGVGGGLPPGAPLRLKPVLTWQLPQRKELTSWRPYGGLTTRADVDAEARRIQGELAKLASTSEFPIQVLPVSLVGSPAEAAAANEPECDAVLIYAASGPVAWQETLAASGKPALMFVRQKSGPLYLYYEIAHFRFLRKSDDAIQQPNMSVDDIIVDDYEEIRWRLRALYGLRNALGTKSLAIGGLRAYTATGQKFGPAHAKDTWKFEIVEMPDEVIAKRLAKARADARLLKRAEDQAAALLAEPNVQLQTERRFVVNSFLALHVFKDLMQEAGASNVGVANCMGSLIRTLDTPPCLVLSLLNDEGYTAFCHTDYTQTPAGVLLRWISGKPSFLSNSHFPHHGMLTIAHCSTPRKMDGRNAEPMRIVTHFESDYGAATRVEYQKGQSLTNIIPNFACTKWIGFRGKIVDTPSYPTCRSQIDMEVDGDWRRLLRNLHGFHTVTCYGEYLRETGYALKRAGLQWDNVSESSTG